MLPGLLSATDISAVFSQVWKPSWPRWSSQWRRWWTSWFWPSSLFLFSPSSAFSCSWEICVRNACGGPSDQTTLHLDSSTPPHLVTLSLSTTPCTPTTPSVLWSILKTQVCLTRIVSPVFSWFCRIDSQSVFLTGYRKPLLFGRQCRCSTLWEQLWRWVRITPTETQCYNTSRQSGSVSRFQPTKFEC